MARPRLLAWLGTVAEVEATLGLLLRIRSRGRVDVRILASAKLLRLRPGVDRMLEGAVPVASKVRIRWAHVVDRGWADAILGINDPLQDRTSLASRSHAIARGRVPFHLVQHGLWQNGINVPGDAARYASDRALLWEAPDVGVLPGRLAERSAVTGFLKGRAVLPRPQPELLRDWQRAHESVALICHSFRWSAGRYGTDDVTSFFDMVAETARARPRTGFLIRSHRGKADGAYDRREADLAAAHPNVMLSRAGIGWRDPPTIEDAIDLSDVVIAPVGTALLDAAYLDRPVARIAERIDLLPELPAIDRVETLLAFLDGPESGEIGAAALRARFGNRDANLDRAAAAMEGWLEG